MYVFIYIYIYVCIYIYIYTYICIYTYIFPILYIYVYIYHIYIYTMIKRIFFNHSRLSQYDCKTLCHRSAIHPFQGPRSGHEDLEHE